MKAFKIGFLLCALPVLLSATLYTIDIQVVQDGEDRLFLQDNVLQWQHISRFANGNATINAWVDGLQVVTNDTWVNGATGTDCSGPHGPCPFMDPNSYTLPFSLVDDPQNLTLTVLPASNFPAGGSLTIFQLPTLGNDWQLKVRFNDDPPGGTHTYAAEITFEGPTVPEPSSMALVGCGLVLAGIILRKKRRLS